MLINILKWKFWKREPENKNSPTYTIWEDENWQKENVLKHAAQTLKYEKRATELLFLIDRFQNITEDRLETVIVHIGYDREEFVRRLVLLQAFCLVICLPQTREIITTVWGKDLLHRMNMY